MPYHAHSMNIEKIFQNFAYICGIDEAGRGPWAGPVFAAAVILPKTHTIKGLNDSKKLSEKERERLFEEIQKQAISFGIASSSEKEIDQLNILIATKKAMMKALKKLSQKPDLIIIDALNLNIPEIPQIQFIKGDERFEAISAASILAKVSRDIYTKKIAKKYPQYGFEIHKGYGTKKHQEILKKMGACPLHRKSFEPIKKLV